MEKIPSFNNEKHIITATYVEKQVAGIGIPNAPVITTGLIPVNWNGSEWATTIKEKWEYDYNSVAETESNRTVSGNGNGKWANAMTTDGSMYVWIPRYTYKITSGYHQDVESWNADEGENKTGKIEIKFSQGTTDDTTDSYISHPAFTFGSDELTGIWVAKYKASRNDATESSKGSGTTVSSKPGVIPWSDLSVSNMFDYAYNLNRDLDSHLMKNVEWGAVAYLTNAIGRIPYINNSINHITGNAGDSQDANRAYGITNAWNTIGGVKASTTHNVYGIYDLSGGTYEYVSAYYTGGISEFLADDTINKTYAGSLYTAANNTATAKYVDTYTEADDNGYAYSSSKLGDAVYETSSSSLGSTSWDSDYSYAPDFYSPVFVRGGNFSSPSEAGVFFFYNSLGVNENNGFRPVFAIR